MKPFPPCPKWASECHDKSKLVQMLYQSNPLCVGSINSVPPYSNYNLQLVPTFCLRPKWRKLLPAAVFYSVITETRANLSYRVTHKRFWIWATGWQFILNSIHKTVCNIWSNESNATSWKLTAPTSLLLTFHKHKPVAGSSLIPVTPPIFWMKDKEKGIGRFIFRKKHAGRSTQLEFDAGENVGVLKMRKKQDEVFRLSIFKCITFRLVYM